MKHQLFRLLIAFFVTEFLITIIPQQIFADETSADLAPLKKKAEQGHAGAQLNLGLNYYSGEGVPQNNKLAHAWFNLAASNGNEIAQKNRGTLAKNMTPKALAEAKYLAAKIQYKIDHP